MPSQRETLGVTAVLVMRSEARPGARPVTVSVPPLTVKRTTSALLVATV